jgi:hypothetical protein
MLHDSRLINLGSRSWACRERAPVRSVSLGVPAKSPQGSPEPKVKSLKLAVEVQNSTLAATAIIFIAFYLDGLPSSGVVPGAVGAPCLPSCELDSAVGRHFAFPTTESKAGTPGCVDDHPEKATNRDDESDRSKATKVARTIKTGVKWGPSCSSINSKSAGCTSLDGPLLLPL